MRGTSFRAAAGPARWSLLACAAVLVACGGGRDDSSRASAASALPSSGSGGGAGRALAASALEKPADFVPPVAIPSDAAQRGMWSPVYNWPLVAVHSVLMPDGRVMTYGTNGDGTQTGRFIYDLWDSSGAPDAGHMTLANGSGTDIFCSSQLILPETGGKVFIAGGDNWTGTSTTNTGNNNSNLVDVQTGTITRGVNMNRARWYSSSTTLLNGEIYVQGGSGGGDRPEIRSTSGAFRLLSGADTSGLGDQFPRNFVAPDGRVFGFDGAGRMYYVNTGGSGSVTRVGQFASMYASNTSSTAMFRPGRILQFGGNSNGAIVIDISGGGTPVVTPTQSMSSQRQWVNATLLADGRVLATSGSQVANQLTGVNNIAEIWNPQTGQWLQGAAGNRARLYHSNALLLPDASVLVSGGGAPAPVLNLNAEIYYPPYLFDGSGQRAARPAIVDAPDALEIGKTFRLQIGQVTGSVSRITLVKTGSTTHSFNMDQRFLDLTFAAEGGGSVAVQAPTRAGEAPPGYYMLFVFDGAGVPSVAKMVRVGVAANPNPATVPTLANPGAQSTSLGAGVSLGLVASDPNGDTLSYGASGLPPGLALSTRSGAITGTASVPGTYNVVVTASDGVNAASANFVWTVQSAAPLTLVAPPPPTTVVANGTAGYTATATGGADLRYRWNFGDGTGDTAWSSSPTVTHVYAEPGIYSVTVTVTDASGAVQSRSFLQTIQLPATAGRPSASTNLLLETPASGNPRLWVVNQDNDSVTGFDAVTRAKLGEVAVGTAPRAIARAANGLLWVTNRQSASISVIDPASRIVSRTIALPRASQPFGIAMSPNGDRAYVVLSASGRLLRFDTASYAQTGSLDVGAEPRHVSVTGDGAQVWVSRFITPPLPGEGTANVSTPLTAGGELVVVDAAAMTRQRTIVLRHSDKPDFENQGRGIPNYLGAAAISPDGSQAWVPSKQDNVKRGALLDGTGLNFQSTVRAISSRVVMATGQEDYVSRIDHDNASVASAAAYDPRGVYLFVALETSREVAVLSAHGGYELMRIDVGRAPQGLAVSADGRTLYVNNFMDRSVSVHDLGPLVQQGLLDAPLQATLPAVATERLAAAVLAGKRHFYDARDTRLARDRYMSCATCHNDGSHDGRVWDMTGFGEGLRNTTSLRGRAGLGHGLLHWSGNFDEVQDFEDQIRAFAGGTGLMTDSAYNTGTRNQALGDRKAGISADLDALAAYVASLNSFDTSPGRAADGSLSSAAAAGRAVFQQHNCAACHGGAAFTNAATSGLADIGSLKPSSGSRLGGLLAGIDIPTLRDVRGTAPYLHDGSAATLEAAVAAHRGVSLAAADATALASYLREIGSEEAGAPGSTAAGTGTGLGGQYYANVTLSGSPALTRTEVPNFDWGTAAPGTGVPADNFSVRWSGKLVPVTSGLHVLRTVSDDGVRLWVDGVLVIDNWTDHGVTSNDSVALPLTAGKAVDLRMEYYERGGGAVARLQWRAPGAASFAAIPAAQLTPAVVAPPTTGLTGRYYGNVGFSGSPLLTRVEAINFDWGTGAPGAGVAADNFSVRWTGTVLAPTTGDYYFRTYSDDGVRVTVNGTRVINNWTDHSPTYNASSRISLAAGRRYTITVEYYERGGGAVMQLGWRTPGVSSYVPVPQAQFAPN